MARITLYYVYRAYKSRCMALLGLDSQFIFDSPHYGSSMKVFIDGFYMDIFRHSTSDSYNFATLYEQYSAPKGVFYGYLEPLYILHLEKTLSWRLRNNL